MLMATNARRGPMQKIRREPSKSVRRTYSGVEVPRISVLVVDGSFCGFHMFLLVLEH